MLMSVFTLQINLEHRGCAAQGTNPIFSWSDLEKPQNCHHDIRSQSRYTTRGTSKRESRNDYVALRGVRCERRPNSAFNVASRLLHKDSRHLAWLASTDHLLARNCLYYTGQVSGETERQTDIKTGTIENVFSEGKQRVLKGKQPVLKGKQPVLKGKQPVLRGINMFWKENNVFWKENNLFWKENNLFWEE